MSDHLAVVARTALVLFAALVLQLGLFDQLRVFSVHAELLLAVAVATAVAWGAERGAIVGFAAGLLTDLILPGRFGVTALAYGLTDEFHQSFVPDRNGRLDDVVTDAIGAAIGVAVAWIVLNAVARSRATATGER